MLKVVIEGMKATKKEGNTLAYFSAILLEGEEKFLILPNMRFAKKQDGGFKVAPAVHRKVEGAKKEGQQKGEDIYPKCYYPFEPLNNIIFPAAEKAYKALAGKTKK